MNTKKTIETERQIIGGQRIGLWDVIIRTVSAGAPDTSTRMGFGFYNEAEAAEKRDELSSLLGIDAG